MVPYSLASLCQVSLSCLPTDRLLCRAAAVHNNGFLPVYDVLPFVVDTPLGPMVQAGIIPLVLAPIWVLYGYLQPLLDEVFADDVSFTHDCECCCTVLSESSCSACSVMWHFSLSASI